MSTEANISTHHSICKHCGSEVNGDYCSNCGYPKEVKRITSSYLLGEIGSVLNLDKGIFFTIRELLLRPGKSIRKYVEEDRKYLISPIVFIIICSLIYTLLQRWFHFEDGYVNFSFEEEATAAVIFKWVSNNYGYANIIMALLIAPWLRLFFIKSRFNIYEILIALCFAMGVGMLIFGFFGVIQTYVSVQILDKAILLGVLYVVWAIAKFFHSKKHYFFFIALLAYFLGMFSFGLFVSLIGFIVDTIFK